MLIQPNIYPTPDFPVIQFRNPREQVNLDEQFPKILLAQGWGCGTYLHVQFLNHEGTELLIDGLFVVANELSSLQTTGMDHATNTKEVIKRKAEQIGDWRYFNGYSESPEDETVTQVTEKATIKWNPGKKVHEVIVGGESVYETSDKNLAQEQRDKLNVAA